MVPLVLEACNPKSILDVGCGTGTWLKVFEEHGIKDFLGIDGDFVELDTLKISADKFLACDLRAEWRLNRKFDLVVSLEVAEHLPENSADLLVSSLVSHGDNILFSAAIPGQGGQNHLNEQWPIYWQRKFEKHGFYFQDAIRQLVWNNPDVEWWYRQNIFLVTKERPTHVAPILPLVHPELFQRTIRISEHNYQSLLEGRHGLKTGLRIFVRSVLYKLKAMIGKK